MIVFSLAFVLGAFFLQQMPVLPNLYWAGVIVPIAGLGAQFHRSQFHFNSYWNFLALVLVGLLAGFFWAASLASLRLADGLPHHWENHPIDLVGVVASVPELTERGERFQFDVEEVQTKGATVPAYISLNAYSTSTWGQAAPIVKSQVSRFWPGERWQLTVRLKRPHGTQNPHGFDFEAWALEENIRAVGSIKGKSQQKRIQNFVWKPRYVVEFVRGSIKQRIARVLENKPYSGVIQALVMGDDSQIIAGDWQVFLRTGTSHLMSISGLHITMLSGLVFGLLSFVWRRVPQLALKIPTRKAATIAGMVTALLYALVAGFSVPTQRTLYMLIVFAFALWSGRHFVISQVLALALFVVVLIDPWAVLSAGFWLSFGAIAVLSFALGGRIGLVNWLRVAIQSQWAVTLGMLPVLLLMFHQASLVSPLANAFAIPMISFLITPLALAGSFLPLDFLLHTSYELLNVCMGGLILLAQSPLSVWQQHAPPAWTLFPALIGVVWMLLPRGFPLRWLGVFGLLPMLLVNPLRPNMGDMKVTVLDVGQGLSVVVQTARHDFLYDTGAKYNAQSDAGSRIVVPFLYGAGIQKLDGFVVSHNDIDHSGGMNSVFSLIPVKWFASSMPNEVQSPNHIPRLRCYAGQRWHWDSVDFEVLHPSLESYENVSLSDNNRSCVVKVTSQAGSLLLTGDIDKSIEFELVSQQADKLTSDVLVAAHHGSHSSSSEVFVQSVHPSIGIFTAGYLNRFKHPRQVVLERFEAIESTIFRSDYHGAISLNFLAEKPRNQISVVSWRHQDQRYWHDQWAN